MIITKLTMHNFGIYASDNTFEFTGSKPIVLIGGLNGRGKTTFLEAVLLSLYGANSFSYKESSFNTYGQYLRSFVNKDDGTLETYVELEFRLNTSDQSLYTVKRSWDAKTKIRTSEVIDVKHNGEHDEFLTQNWPMFIESILPSALSNFFFFDGEKIADLAVDNTNKQLKESIRAMLGITTLDILKKDLRKSIRRLQNKSNVSRQNEEVGKLRTAKEEAEKKVTEANDAVIDKQKELDNLQKELETQMNLFTAQGGNALAVRREMEKEAAVLHEKIDSHNTNMVAMAAGKLPLSLVRDLLANVAEQSQKEHQAEENARARAMIQKFYKDYPDAESDDAVKRFVEYVNLKTENTEVEQVFNLSDHDLFTAQQLANKEIRLSIEQVKSEIAQHRINEEKLKTTENYLSIDIDEEHLNKINEKIISLQTLITAKEEELVELKEKLSSANGDLRTATVNFNHEASRILKGIENDDDNNRTIKYAEMAIQVLDEYEIRIQKSKISELADTITSCYKRLADKKNLIDHVEMDPVTLDWKYINGDGNEVEKNVLSAGEKQLMVISILWALAICSKKKLPVIIDTPLSRMDSNHRKALITVYFPNASDQTIILSTDSEIDEKYYQLIKENVGDEFTLVYDDEKQRTRIEKGYFGY